MRLLFSMLGLVACATVEESVIISYNVVDDQAQRAFQLSFRNMTRHRLCLDPEHWPNTAGKLNQASGQVATVIDGQRFAIHDFNTGYCVGGCPTRVPPGEELRASIPYSEFDFPPALENREKRLEFAPRAYRC